MLLRACGYQVFQWGSSQQQWNCRGYFGLVNGAVGIEYSVENSQSKIFSGFQVMLAVFYSAGNGVKIPFWNSWKKAPHRFFSKPSSTTYMEYCSNYY